MAVNHTPPGRSTVGGPRLAGWLNQLELSNTGLLSEIATVMETIDGGEANAADVTKMARVLTDYGFADAASAVAAIGQLQAIRFALTESGNQSAFAQAFNRLRG